MRHTLVDWKKAFEGAARERKAGWCLQNKKSGNSAHKLLPRVHKVISLFKRWLLGTHQGAISHEHMNSYVNEFVFRFNRRTSTHRGKLFLRLAQQAVAGDPLSFV